jgi:hypothetical protein|tara:strand:- start:24271 stop:24486 length:216 start_codon:yes stop_codon:yes gene_type:complete
MRTQDEKDEKIAELFEEMEKYGDRDIRNMQVEIIEADDYNEEADLYEMDEDSNVHQGAETARAWLDGQDWY